MRFPPDLDKHFAGTWESFTELTAVQDVIAINPLIAEDAFRILLTQAGYRTKTQFTVKRFITVKHVVEHMRRKLDLTHVLNHMNVGKTKLSIELPAVKAINVIYRPVITGRMQLRPRAGFELDFLLKRMEQLKAFKNFPEQLAKSKRLPTEFNIHPRDWYTFHRDHQWSLQVCRLRNGSLVLEYQVTVGAAFPTYPDAEKQLTAIWKSEISGVF